MASFWETLSTVGSSVGNQIATASTILARDLKEMAQTLETDVNSFVAGEEQHSEDDGEEDEIIAPCPYKLLRQTVSTFTTDPTDKQKFNAWLINFQSKGGVQEHRSLMDELLTDIVSYDHYNTLVPSSCSAEEFWSRYTYKWLELNKSVALEQERNTNEKVVSVTTVDETPTEETELPLPPTTKKKGINEITKTDTMEESEEPTTAATDMNTDMNTEESQRTTKTTSSPEIKPRSPSPKVVVTKMELPTTEAIAEDWELWE